MSMSLRGTYVGVASQIAIQPFSTNRYKVSGKYYSMSQSATAPLDNVVIPADTITATPIILAEAGVFDQLRIEPNVPTIGGHFRVGLYSNDDAAATPYPATALERSGSIALDGGYGTTVYNFAAARTLAAGLYWLVIICDTGGSGTLYGQTTDGEFPLFGTDNPDSTPRFSWDIAQAYGALPATMPAGGSAASVPPTVFLRVD